MSYETVLYLQDGPVVTISLNRPDVLNAQNRRLILETRQALERAEADRDVRVVILAGEGRAFCTGDDLNEDFSDIKTAQDTVGVIENLQNVTRVLLRMPQPVIAAVHGYVLGAGCEWCMNCDIRIAADDAKFGFPETRWGYTVTNAGTKLLPMLVGLGRAKELVFTTDRIDAATAERWGLVNRVVPLADLRATALSMATRIARNSALALALSKRALNSGVHLSYDETLRQEVFDAVTCARSPETQERVAAAFSDKK